MFHSLQSRCHAYISQTTWSQTTGTTYQTGQDIVVRAQFINNSVLTNALDTDFRAVQDRFPVFALAEDLGMVTDASEPVVFSIGHFRDPVASYIVAENEFELRSSYFLSAHSSIDDAVRHTFQVFVVHVHKSHYSLDLFLLGRLF